MKALFQELIQKSPVFVELRYHKRKNRQFLVTKGRVDVSNVTITEGVGVRVNAEGTWGFAATAKVDRASIERAIQAATKNAKILREKSNKPHALHFPKERLSKVDYVGDGFKELESMAVQDKLGFVVACEQKLAKSSPLIHTAKARYTEILEEKTIATSDGASCSLKLAQPEMVVSAIAEKDGDRSTSFRGAGVSGGWQCLFNHPTLHEMVEETSHVAIDLLKAKYPQGGRKKVILAPSLVGLLCHEAIGHTVEADFVKAGSVAQGKIGTQVASPLVTMVDSGCERFSGYAVGNLPFDDEGVETEETVIIKNGILSSYLHNRESAMEFGVAPTGNARAWLYSDEPLIRMRNTYIRPGSSSIEEMISQMDDGFLIEGAGGGQADSNGEFMFGSGYVWRIKNGKKAEIMREVTLSGIAFDVLKSVDAVSKEFQWDLGTGYCGKGQPAKVDAGGPYIRCEINLGGRQE